MFTPGFLAPLFYCCCYKSHLFSDHTEKGKRQMNSDTKFVQELGEKAKDLSEEEQRKMSDTGKAVKDAAEAGYDKVSPPPSHPEITRFPWKVNQEYDGTSGIMAQKLTQAMDYVIDKREFARVFANKAKNMKEAEQQEKNETRKAVKNAQ
ncbi:hypothetical protein OESDEN_10592, partial [Oesophagostomum dentatum]